MASGDIKILDKLYVNQNLICLVVSYIFLERLKCCCCCNKWVYFCCIIFFTASTISVIISLYCYIKEYWNKKKYKEKCHKLRYEYIKEKTRKDSLTDACGEKIISW